MIDGRTAPKRNATGVPVTTCSHIAWAERWSRILNHYNSDGLGYTLSGGLSDIIRSAIKTYGAQ